jgi:hypothetical protein
MTRLFRASVAAGWMLVVGCQFACSQAVSIGRSNAQEQSSAQTAKSAPASKQWTGLLSRKGSAPEIWWALSVSGDHVYRLDGVETTSPNSVNALQNQTVRVEGKVTGSYLSFPIITVEALTPIQPH